MISHHDKCLFVHVPKCAGQSVEIFFLRRVGLDWQRRAPLLLRANDVAELGPPRLAHLKAVEYLEKKWVTADQFDQYFKFTFVRNPWDRIASFYRYLGYDRLCSFSTFVAKHLPAKMEKKAWFLCPQADYLYDSEGKLRVNFVGRFETLAADFATVCERMGIPDRQLPHVNDSHKRGPVQRFRRRPRPYKEMYDERSRAIVASLYAADVEAFGYSF